MRFQDIQKADQLRLQLRGAKSDHTNLEFALKNLRSAKVVIEYGPSPHSAKETTLYAQKDLAASSLRRSIERAWSEIVSLRCQLRQLGVVFEDTAEPPPSKRR